MQKKLRFLALYLPQYHPIEENNIWWGNGFTEWRNVVKGKPLVKGHYQPHIPKDLGFYDLRLQETRLAQVDLAKKYGIYGFVYYHYWFNGKLLLETPIQKMINEDKTDFPFCICWANENWSRRWDGQDKEILMEQNYNDLDNEDHMRYLCKSVFFDDRYIKINSKPVFIIYKAALIPNLESTIDKWNKIAVEYGYNGIYLIVFERSYSPQLYNGVDKINAFAEFSPFLGKLNMNRSFVDHLFAKLGLHFTVNQKNKFFDYKNLLLHAEQTSYNQKKILYPCVTPMWDNYVRRRNGNAEIFIGSTPQLFKKWLSIVCEKFTPKSSEENFVFINAWNEWAEGNHLEPCETWGHSYLEATKQISELYS